MKRLLVLAALAATGCGGSVPFQPKQTCAIDGATFFLESPGDCNYYRAVATDAERALTAYVGVPADRAASLLVGRDVWVHRDNMGFQCHGTNDADVGCNHDGTGDIEVTVTAGSLLHELLHALDKANGVPLKESQAHQGWGSRNAIAESPWIATAAGEKLPGSWFDLCDNAFEGWDKVFFGYESAPTSGVVTTPSYWYIIP